MASCKKQSAWVTTRKMGHVAKCEDPLASVIYIKDETKEHYAEPFLYEFGEQPLFDPSKRKFTAR